MEMHHKSKIMEVAEGKKRSDEIMAAQALLWSHVFNHIDSMTLKCAIELGIPDAIDSHGRPITLTELLYAVSLSHTKAPYMRRLMRMLTHSGFFTCSCSQSNGEEVYSLTPLSQILVNKDEDTAGLDKFVLAMLHPVFLKPFQSMSNWFRGDEDTPFSSAHGSGIWDVTNSNPEVNQVFNEGMKSESKFVMNVLLEECRQVFEGLTSLVDVGGGTGYAAMAISKAFPQVKCTVLELPQVVDAISDHGDINFVVGNMFEYIPPSDAILLKWILHDWGDQECVKILKKCREAIHSKEDRGKVIIIDMVFDANNQNEKSKAAQLYFDMMMMVECEGIERGEQEWRKIFTKAGFSDYKIIPALGVRSVIEIFP